MRSFRTSVALAALGTAVCCWSGVSRADDTAKGSKGTSSQQTTQSSTTKSGSSQSGTTQSGATQGSQGSSSTGDVSPSGSTMTGSDTMSPSDTSPYDTTQPSGTSTTGTPGSMTDTTGTDTTGTGTTYGTTGTTGSTYGTQPMTQPYDHNYQTTTSTTTTTAAEYNEMAGAERAGYTFRPNRPLLATGAGIFIGSYGASAIVAAANDNSSDDNLFIPVAGPWIDLADRPCGLGDCGSTEDWNQALIIGSGVLQGVGVGLAVASLIIPEHRESNMAQTPRERSIAASKPKVQVLPVNMRGGGGLGAVGTF